MITVKKLRELLEDLPDDLVVVLSGDGEGNSHGPMADSPYSIGKYFPDTEWSGEFVESEYLDDEERDPSEGADALCLWPSN